MNARQRRATSLILRLNAATSKEAIKHCQLAPRKPALTEERSKAEISLGFASQRRDQVLRVAQP
jgi:hypothetical protein